MGGGGSKEKGGEYLIETIADHEDTINCMALSEDQSLIVTGSEDKTLQMYSTKTEETESLGKLIGHTSYITCVTICDTFVISGSADMTIRKWEMESCECLVKYVGHTSRISRLICTGEVIFSTSYDKMAMVWDFDPELSDRDIEWDSFRTYKGHTKAVYGLIYIPEPVDPSSPEIHPLKFHKKDVLITGSADCTAKSWSAETGICLQTFKEHRGGISCITTDPMGEILYTGSYDTSILSWNIATGERLKEMVGHTAAVLCLLVVNKLMYSSDQDGKAKCWVREFADCTRTYTGHKHSIPSLKFREGVLYTGSGDTTVRAFDSKSGALKRIFIGHEAAVGNIAVVGDKLFSTSYDASLRVWDIKNIQDDPDMELDEEEVEDKFQKRQQKNLTDLDTQLNGYGNDVDNASTPQAGAF